MSERRNVTLYVISISPLHTIYFLSLAHPLFPKRKRWARGGEEDEEEEEDEKVNDINFSPYQFKQ